MLSLGYNLSPWCAPCLKDKKQLQKSLEQQARQCAWLVLWLDCDREGENIAFEVSFSVCDAATV